jgi:hypothetical protein
MPYVHSEISYASHNIPSLSTQTTDSSLENVQNRILGVLDT